MRARTGAGLAAASACILLGAARLGQAGGGHAVPSGVHVAAPAPQPTTTGSPPAAQGAPAAPVSVTGPAVDTPYGTVQVRAVLQSGKLVDVVPLRLTDVGGRSREIDAYAVPQLHREALAAQSANIDAVSGASYTSAGYQQSLQGALDAARRG